MQKERLLPIAFCCVRILVGELIDLPLLNFARAFHLAHRPFSFSHHSSLITHHSHIMASSRSTSPFPSSDAISATGALSNDALYAPLSTYNDTSYDKNRHSLTLQTSTSLRESSLLTFLSGTTQSLKTPHPYECNIYKSIGGSLTRNGMGDADYAGDVSKSFFESKLSNRSLVLVGGGVHSHAERGEGGVTSMVQAAAAGKKRERKRVGGNGLFGSLSGTKRKKILKRCAGAVSNNLQCDVFDGTAIDESNRSTSPTPSAKPQEDINKVIETMHNMWIEYITELMLHVEPPNSNSTEKKSKSNNQADQSMTISFKRQIASLTIEAEHVGMAATIIECPSRRFLINRRCVIVKETVNTYKAAMLVNKSRTKKEKIEAHYEEDADDSSPCTWNAVVIPKRRTVLEVEVPLLKNMMKDTTSVLVRLET